LSDAAERLDLAGQCLSSISKAFHMWVQPACNRGDLRLVARAVELGLHRVRRGRDLTERQRGRKDFGQ
jgi:hypothetical protein